MKRIVVLSCLKATGVCSGAACFQAINRRQGSFQIYENEAVEVEAFFHCNGCDCNYEVDSEFQEKIERVIGMKPDSLHVGKCTQINGRECPVITNIVHQIQTRDILVIRGTHG